ncbi:MAG TPA: SH3 domain-containing protein [Phycisphaerae bacterium]|nr:SH3 domain-containing protein [Phycisphaerae bacterium]
MAFKTTLIALALIVSQAAAQTGATATPPYAGKVVGQDVYIRSGPGDYVCMKLSAPAAVLVVGEASDWLKIAPPAGSYSLVAKPYVTIAAGGAAGTIKGTNVNVRAGSALEPTRADFVQTRLNNGDEVVILGEHKASIAGKEFDFYRIKPPPGAMLWIAARFVRPASAVVEPPVTEATTRPVAVGPTTTAPTTLSADSGDGTSTVTTTQPIAQISREVAALQLAEKALEAENAKGREERNLAAVLALYKAIPLSQASPLESVVKAQIQSLQIQLSLNDDLKEVTELLAEVAAQQERLKLAARDTDIKLATTRPVQASAEGVLRRSNLYPGGPVGKRYLVRDPDESGRITYIQCTTGLVDLESHLGDQIRVLGVSRFDVKLPAHVIEVEELKVLAPAPKTATTLPADADRPTPEPRVEPEPKAEPVPEPQPEAPAPAAPAATQPAPPATQPALPPVLPVVDSVTPPETGVNVKEYE